MEAPTSREVSNKKKLAHHLSQRLLFATELAQQCGALAVAQSANLHVSDKGVHDVLTQADLVVEQFIRAQVKAHFPNDLVVGEEMGGLEATNSEANFWLVDPIDGTANFATDNARWCVSIAYLVSGKPALGVLFEPVLRRLYIAASGQGATVNGKAMHVRRTASLQGATVELGWSPRRAPRIYIAKAQALLDLGCAFTRRGSGALGLADVAAGRTDGYAELHINSWDCAAGVLLVTEAGGRTNNFFTAEGIHLGGIIVASPFALYDEFSTLMLS